MRIACALFLFLNFNIFASDFNCDDVNMKNTGEVASYLSNCNEPDAFDINKDISNKCGETLTYADGKSCTTEDGSQVGHCPKDSPVLCFDGKILKNQGRGANIMLLDILCNDTLLAPVPIKNMGFGICDLKIDTEFLHVDGKVICSCKASKSPGYPAGWACTNDFSLE